MVNNKCLDLEQRGKEWIYGNIKDIKLFFVLFAINIIIYGNKIFFNSLAQDDYHRYFIHVGDSQSYYLGRWMATIFNEHIFTGALQILPYFNGLLGVLSFCLAGFLTAKFLKRKNILEISFTTLLISATPYFAHNLFFNTNISAWIFTALGVWGFMLCYKKNKFTKVIGFILLVLAIGIYQTIVQVTIAMLLFKTILEILELKNAKEFKQILFNAFLFLFIIFLSFVVSNLINLFIMHIHHQHSINRYHSFIEGGNLKTYIHRIVHMYHMNFKVLYFNKVLHRLPEFMGILALISILYKIFIFKEVKEHKLNFKIKINKIIILALLLLSIPIIIFLPYIIGTTWFTPRMHYTLGWIIAGFFILGFISTNKILKFLVIFLAFILIIINTFYINIFFDVSARQTSSDITRVNQIVSRIRENKNYIKEPMEFRIIGTKSFPVIGQHTAEEALNHRQSKYKIFKYFTDFKAFKMSDTDYKKLENILVKRGKIINSYPAKNSIFFYKNKAILFLNPSSINALIKKKKLFNKNHNLLNNQKLGKVTFSGFYNIYLKNNYLIYKKSPCAFKDTKHRFFLHTYIKTKNGLKWKNLDFTFLDFGEINNNTCIAIRKFKGYSSRFNTGQFSGAKTLWQTNWIKLK